MSRIILHRITSPSRFLQSNTTCTQRYFSCTQLKNEEHRYKGRNGMIAFDPIAGTRDFLPKQMNERNWLFSKMRESARKFGFQEYDVPILEPEDLYKRKGGEEISQQMYCFEDGSGQRVSLRPEMTPSLARMVLGQGASLIMPIKYFSIPQCWRYETMTKGRRREHYQLNLDIWGSKGICAEAELIACMCDLFTSLGLTSSDIVISINNRKILQYLMNSMGVPEQLHSSVFIAIDKFDKIGADEVTSLLNEIGISQETSKKIISFSEIRNIKELHSHMGSDHELVVEIENLFHLCSCYGVESFIEFNASIVRGLSYYSGTIFEAYARDRVPPRALCGGGRYDNILTMYGAANDIPACGFGLGDVMMLEILREKKLVPESVINEPAAKSVVIPMNESLRGEAAQVVTLLRKQGTAADVYVGRVNKLKNALNFADRVGAERVIMIMPDEWANGSVVVKYLRRKEQFEVRLQDLITFDPNDLEK
ncbi:histidinyl tRS [Acrasis kona]|uniref:histidine--tRNA ligase n=1 Tax=Acrasis kona TaxID=1008807 RepID=A0AAW2Z167_9EUKA